jgi:hypothetical protein
MRGRQSPYKTQFAFQCESLNRAIKLSVGALRDHDIDLGTFRMLRFLQRLELEHLEQELMRLRLRSPKEKAWAKLGRELEHSGAAPNARRRRRVIRGIQLGLPLNLVEMGGRHAA